MLPQSDCSLHMHSACDGPIQSQTELLRNTHQGVLIYCSNFLIQKPN